MVNRITIGPPGSILDWDNWGKPITDAVNEIGNEIGEKATKITSTTVGNTTTETQIISRTIVGGSSVAGTIHRLKVWGTFAHSAAAVNLTFRAKLGGSSISVGFVTPATAFSARTFSYTTELVCLTVGATATWSIVFDGFQVNGFARESQVEVGSITKDSTVNQTFEVTMQWGTADAANVLVAQAGHYERVSSV